MKLLKDVGLNWKDRRLISEIYRDQRVAVRIGDDQTE